MCVVRGGDTFFGRPNNLMDYAIIGGSVQRLPADPGQSRAVIHAAVARALAGNQAAP
jgi:hypothetical protein